MPDAECSRVCRAPWQEADAGPASGRGRWQESWRGLPWRVGVWIRNNRWLIGPSGTFRMPHSNFAWARGLADQSTTNVSFLLSVQLKTDRQVRPFTTRNTTLASLVLGLAKA